MTHPLLNTIGTTQAFEQTSSTSTDKRALLPVADACFEMFSVRELKRPRVILPELLAAFPEFSQEDILSAVSLALSWKRILRAAGKPLH